MPYDDSPSHPVLAALLAIFMFFGACYGASSAAIAQATERKKT